MRESREVIKDIKFTKKVIFTYYMVDTHNIGNFHVKWKEIDDKCFGNIRTFSKYQ
jgi:hypothetical protein